MNRALKHIMLALAAGLVACGDAAKGVRPAPAPDFDVRTTAADGSPERLVGGGRSFRHYRNGELFAAREGDILEVHRPGRTVRITLARGLPEPALRPNVLAADVLMTETEADEAGCWWELADVVVSAALLATAVDVAAGITVVTAATATPAAISAVVAAAMNYAKAVDKYAKCVKKENETPSTPASPDAL